MRQNIEFVTDNSNTVLAIIIYDKYNQEGVSFITPGEYSQQLAYMHHPVGKIIQPHVHNLLFREIQYTQEVLVIKKGKLRVDFYSLSKEYLFSKIVGTGDTILLASGGHGFEVLEEVEMIEVKQGPYSEEKDKEKFNMIQKENVIINEVIHE
jgi:hypothetical protein